MLLLNAGVDYYIFRFLKKRCAPVWSRIQLWSAVFFMAGLAALFFVPVKALTEPALRALMWVIFIYITIYVPKFIFVIFDLIGRIPVLFRGKRIFLATWTGAVIGAIIFCALWWGALFNRFNIQVREVTVPVENFPARFDGLKIAQISDLHVGTYGTDTAFIAKLVAEVNSLNPDVIFFTGDIVNSRTDELLPFTGTLSRLKAKYGVFSVLGNHDYGDYTKWSSEEEHRANNLRLATLQKNMGWKMLNNDHDYIAVGNDTLVIIGVENIGDPPFHVYGDLKKSYSDLTDSLPKILLSHNPAHWENEISGSDLNIPLTLSGHTHAMQMSFFGFSPASFRYDKWGGLYTDADNKHALYVNIGTGTVGFPARIGATPEITLITLSSSERK